LEKLGFPWIPSTELNLFNGLREIFAEIKFSRPLARGSQRRGGRQRFSYAEAWNCSWGKLSLLSGFLKAFVVKAALTAWRKILSLITGTNRWPRHSVSRGKTSRRDGQS
jgi:hypothetical protein